MKKKYNVNLIVEVDAPDDATEEDIEAFIRYEFHYSHGISSANPCFEDGDYNVKDCDITPVY